MRMYYQSKKENPDYELKYLPDQSNVVDPVMISVKIKRSKRSANIKLLASREKNFARVPKMVRPTLRPLQNKIGIASRSKLRRRQRKLIDAH